MRHAFRLLKNAAGLQRRLREAEARLKREKVEHRSADGRVRVVVNCGLELEELELTGDCLDRQTNRWLVREINAALQKARVRAAGMMGSLVDPAGTEVEEEQDRGGGG